MRNLKTKLANLLSILLSFGIALGGLVLVQSRLLREEADLFRSGGKITFSAPSGGTESEKSDSVSIAITLLSDQELAEAVQNLENGSDIYPHEPLPGQLSMVQAIETGKDWIGDFVLSHFWSRLPMPEYRADCYLWTPLESNADPLFSYWTVNLSSQNINASLILNAVSGQVLDASLSSSLPVEYLEEEPLFSILDDYSASFGLERDNYVISAEKTAQQHGRLYQSIGKSGTFAAISSDNIANSSAGDSSENPAFFTLHLYLSSSLP